MSFVPGKMVVFKQSHHGRLAARPAMKMKGRAADFCGIREKREENETMISMWKKANVFFFPGSYFLFPSPSFLTIFTEKGKEA
jgi:hypothetical protein